jgi:membrane protein implicated in regulation of membrane protease activity
MTIGVLYVGLLGLGVVYAILSGALGWLADLGDGDIHLDASGHLDAGHPHPLSGTIVATFLTGFGGGGVMAHYILRWSLLPGLVLATGTGLALGAAAFGILEVIFKHTQAGSEFVPGEATGREGEVITPIPEGGMGEVAYVMRGQRESAPARSASAVAVPKGTLVLIEKVSGSTLYVRPKG